MTAVIIATSFVLAILLMTLLIVPVMQQRRLLRTRARCGGRILATQDQERATIARELHDHLVQDLLASTTNLRLTELSPVVPIADGIDRVIQGLRELAQGIHPPVVDHVGLADAIRDLGKGFEERNGITVEWCDGLDSEGLNHSERLALFRVAQEALGNVAKHPEVGQVQVALRSAAGMVELSIRDQGKGFHKSKMASSRGIGLTSMKERMMLLGGTLLVETSPRRGTRVTARIPTRRGNQ